MRYAAGAMFAFRLRTNAQVKSDRASIRTGRMLALAFEETDRLAVLLRSSRVSGGQHCDLVSRPSSDDIERLLVRTGEGQVLRSLR